MEVSQLCHRFMTLDRDKWALSYRPHPGGIAGLRPTEGIGE